MSEDLIPEFPAESRQAARLQSIPELYRTTHERLACELSLKMEDADAIFSAYGYSADEAAQLCESPAFISLLERVAREIRESGLSFKTKIKAVAEDLIPTAYDLATDPYTSAAVRKDIIIWAAKLAGHEDGLKKDEGKTGGGLTLSIQFSGNPPQTVLTGREPVLIENENQNT